MAMSVEVDLPMKQPIAGVAPAELSEVEVMTVWPSICSYGAGRMLGRLYSIDVGIFVVTVGNLIALASIPLALALYFLRVAPFIGTRYRVTNRRILVLRGIVGKREDRSISLERFDDITIQVQDGQEWFKAGDLVFHHAGTETFRLPGVSRPEAFRHVCENARMSHVGVKQAIASA